MKFEDRSHGETERQQRCARSKAWNLEKYTMLNEKDKVAFYFPAQEWVLPAASTKEPVEKEFVVDSGARMHMVSRKDLNSAELETVRISKNPTTVMTANGEVQTKEEATVYVKELDLFVTVMLLEELLAVLPQGNSVRIMGVHTTGPAVKNHISSKMAGKSIAKIRTTYYSLSLVYQRVPLRHLHLLLQHIHRRVLYLTSGKKWKYE